MSRRLGLDAPVPPVTVEEQAKGMRVLVPALLIVAFIGLLLRYNIVNQTNSSGETKEGPDGYVALGAFDKDAKTYANFRLVSGAPDEGGVKKDDIMKAKTSVYLRTNTDNTESDKNPSYGTIPEGGCVRILEWHDNIRGQTWASVKRLAKCG